MAKKLTGVERIAKERQRQVEVEGFDADHDAQHEYGDLALAAACYASPAPLYVRGTDDANGVEFLDPWPASWDSCWDHRPRDRHDRLKKPTRAQRIRMLEKAGALIAAEIDRLLEG